jgi:hypothetical protein
MTSYISWRCAQKAVRRCVQRALLTIDGKAL